MVAFSQLCPQALGSVLPRKAQVWKSEDNVRETVLSFMMWVLGKLRSIGHAGKLILLSFFRNSELERWFGG